MRLQTILTLFLGSLIINSGCSSTGTTSADTSSPEDTALVDMTADSSPIDHFVTDVTTLPDLQPADLSPEAAVLADTSDTLADIVELANEELPTLDLEPELEIAEPVCVAETCNGLDDDCDGDIDEPDMVGGNYVNLCNDDNECTKDICGGLDGCTYDDLAGGECKDGDACTVGDHCEEGECVGTPIVCDDLDGCTDDSCDGTGGCQFIPNFAPCDDDDPCTVKDSCDSGICSGFAIACACQIDADCAPLEDGDLCNGTLVCDTTALPYQCVVEEATMVTCPLPPADSHAICLQPWCDPATGNCQLVPDHEGLACDDGNACTMGDACASGACVPGVALECHDDNPCTDDSCHAELGCQFVANTLECSDNDACTVGDLCIDGGCQAGPASLGCDDGNPCTTDSCDAASGCGHSPNEASCDDGNPCTLGDHCSGGMCLFDSLKVCNDDNLCTDDSCGDDGECLFALNSVPCDDSNLCTTEDHCQLGECLGSGVLHCNDGNECTDDTCVPESGCQYTANSAPCDDNNVCTLNDQCAKGWCGAGSVVDCDDGSPCTADSCDPVLGCQYTAFDDGPCNNGDPCTVGDMCVSGICFPGNQELDCNDDNVCTDDHCEPWVGCQHLNNNAPCTDDKNCTTGDQCAGGVCVPGQQELDCNDNNVCTDDSCDDSQGCLHIPNAEPCSDGNPCTINDFCSNGSCHFGYDSLDCDDSDDCTVDSCQSAVGCTYSQAADGIPCGNEEGWACKTGVCTNPDQPTKLVFVTSIGHDGNLGGIAGADAFCMARATAAGLPGTFKAWLSAGEVSSSPSVRFTKSDVPYALIDGTIIAANWADLTDGALQAPINKTELNGTPTYGPSVFSFTRVNGTPGLFDNPNHVCYGTNCHCNGWTTTQTQGYNKPGSAVGEWNKPNDDWTDYSFANACASTRGLYCFEQ
jgi:hypothetical protein